MIAQLRIYQLKAGMADDYIKVFHAQLEPNHMASGVKIAGAWIDEETNTVYRLCVFKEEEEMNESLDRYQQSDARKNLDPVGGYAVQSSEIHVMRDIMSGNNTRDDSVLEGEFAEAARALFTARQFERSRSGEKPPLHR